MHGDRRAERTVRPRPGVWLLLATLAGAPVMANSAATGIYYPVDADWTSIYTRVESSIRAGEWRTAIEGVRELFRRLEQRRPDAGETSRSVVLASGGGFALGPGPALNRLVDLLPPEARAELGTGLEPLLRARWTEADDAASPQESARIRGIIVRDYAWTPVALEAAREDVERSLEHGALDRAAEACAFLRSRSPDAGERLRAGWLLAKIARLRGDGELWRRTAGELRAGLEQAADLSDATRAAIVRELDEPFPAEWRAPSSAILSPLVLREPRGSAVEGIRFELGNVQARRRFEVGELRNHLYSRLPPPTPVVSPLLGPAKGGASSSGEEPIPGGAGSLRDGTQSVTTLDFPLPFFPTARGKRVYFQTYRELIAYSVPSLETAWTATISTGAHEALGSLRCPAIGPDRIIATAGENVVCADDATGSVLWRRVVTYSRPAQRLRVDSPEELARVTGEARAARERPVVEDGAGDPGRDAGVADNDVDGGDPKENDGNDPGGAGDENGDDGNAPGVVVGVGDKPEDEEDDEVLFVPVDLTPATPSLGDYVIGAAARVDSQVLAYVARLRPDGDAAWITYLGSTQSPDHLGMASTLSPPLVLDGRVYLLTNRGFVAALDERDGNILWLQAYERLSDGGKKRSIDDWDRWQPNPILAWRGQLIVTPQDTDTLIALDARTGEILWRVPREGHSTILGATSHACLLGGSSVTAIELADPARRGTALWRWQPSGRSLISLGRAFVDGDRVFVSDINALYALDAETGAQRSSALWDFRGGGGNLLRLAGGQFLGVGSAGGLLVYNHRDAEARRIELLPPASEERLLEMAKLHLKAGDAEAAKRSLALWSNRGFPEPAPNSRIDRLLFEISEALRYTVDIRGEHDDNAPDLLQFLSRTERLPEFSAVAAFRAARLLVERGRYDDGVTVVRDALERGLGEASCPVNRFLASPGRVVAESVLEGVRSSGTAGKTAFTNFEWDAQEALARARQQGTQVSFESVVRGFPLTRARALAHLELANIFQDQQNLNESVRWLLSYLRDYPDADDYVPVALRAANQLTELGAYVEARDLLLALANERPDERLTSAEQRGLGETVATYVRRRIREPGFRELSLPTEGRWLRFPIELKWRSPANLVTSRRRFLEASGEAPPHLAKLFLTYSKDVIECRDIDTGLVVWKVEFAMVPQFQLPRFSFRNEGAAFVGDLLIFHDTNNVLCIDTTTGKPLWNKTFEVDEGENEKDARRIFSTVPDETVVGVGVARDPTRVVVRTSKNRLHALDRTGEEVFSLELPYTNTRYKGEPIVTDRAIVLFRQAPIEVAYFDPTDGKEIDTVRVGETFPDTRPTLRRVLPLDGGRALLMTTRDVVVVDIDGRRPLSRYALDEGILDGLWDFPAYPDQVLVYSVHRGRRRVAGVSMTTGKELWRYDKFKEQRFSTPVKPLIRPDGTSLYVLYGSENRFLAAFDVRPGPEVGEFTVLRIWSDDIDLGLKFGRQLDLIVTHDSVIFPDPISNTISVFDKRQRTDRRAVVTALEEFLIDKRPGYECAVKDGMLLVLSDRGDGGFGAAQKRVDLYSEREKIDRLKRYLSEPTDWENVLWLALKFFQEENADAALEILGRALLSEHLPSLDSPGKYQQLRAIFDGIKEESIKNERPDDLIVCRRFRTPPNVDGELNENWNLTESRSLEDLRSINLIPSIGQDSDIWKGKEDLSGRLYTGWDDDYFYFAIDVRDNRIFPYDKEAKFWKGDCLIIGLDPEGDGGLYQSGRDQLLTLALTLPNRKPRDEDEEGEDGEEEEKRKPKGKYSVKKKDDNSGVIYEAAIPWDSFGPGLDGRPPLARKRFGLSLVVTDDDTGQGATKMMSLKPCHLIPRDQISRSIWRHLIPKYFPTVVLE